MSVTTVNGASMPTTPTVGERGFRGYERGAANRIKQKAKAAIECFALSVRAARNTEGETETVRESLHQQMDLVGAILTVVIAGAAAYAGINVMSTVGSSMGLDENSTFYNASQSLEGGIDSFFTQLPTVFVVIALVLIISYLTILRQR